jgi:hypothetical protein
MHPFGVYRHSSLYLSGADVAAMMDEFRSYVLREISEIRYLVVKIIGGVDMGSLQQQSLGNVRQASKDNNANDAGGRRVLLIF